MLKIHFKKSIEKYVDNLQKKIAEDIIISVKIHTYTCIIHDQKISM